MAVSTVRLGVLVGGASHRWGGYPKAMLDWYGQPMVHAVIQRLCSVSLLGLCVRSEQLSWSESLGLPLIIESDDMVGAGPLKGMVTLLLALQETSDEWLLVVPCDMPLLPLNLADTLLQAAQVQCRKSMVLCDAAGGHTAVVLLHRSLIAQMLQMLSDGERRLKVCYQALSSGYYRWPIAECDDVLINMNTPEVYAAHKYLSMKSS